MVAENMLLLLLACAPALVCGPGTYASDGMCRAAAAPATDALAVRVAPLEVYVVAGQSNADGFSPVTGLPPSQRVAQRDIPFYWAGAFRKLAPASSAGAQHMGPEVAFGRALKDAGHPVAVVKQAQGATGLATWWHPGADAADPKKGAGWIAFAETIAAVSAELDAAGTPWRWAGLAWVQGESDARYPASARAYEANFRRFVARVREETGVPDLPVAVALVSCRDLCEWQDTVRAAQMAVADADPNVVAVETNDLPRVPTDRMHFDGPSMRVLGERLAQALLGAAPSPPPRAALALTSHASTADGDATVGWRFRTDRPIVVTDVGAFGTATLHASPGWGLWETATGTLLARGSVPGRFEALTSHRDGFWYTAIDPLPLPPGDYVIGLTSFRPDGNVYALGGAGVTGAGVTWVEPRMDGKPWLGFPDEVGAGEGMGYLGPGFLYRE